MDLLTRISSFLAPKATAAGSSVINTAGMLKDYLEYNFAKDKTNKQKQLIEYNQKRNLANEALKQFGFDANKKGNQFDPGRYAKGVTQGGLELGSFAVPFGKGANIASRVLVPGATVGAMQAGAQETVTPQSLATGALTGAAGAGILKGATNTATRAIKGAGNFLVDKATQGIGKASPSMFEKAVAEKGFNINELIKKYTPAGAGYDDLLGPIKDRGNGGVIGSKLQEAEKIIQATAKQAGSTVRIAGDDLIKALKAEAKNISSELGGASRKKAINSLIKEAEKKYKGGVTVQRALDTLRRANKKFGKNIVDTDPGDAVATAAQKLEGNIMRKTLKQLFPDLAGALDTQSELLTLQPILNRARGTSSTQGSSIRIGNVNPLNPMSWIEAAANNPRISSRVINPAGSLAEPMQRIASRVPTADAGMVGSQLLSRALVGNQQGNTTQNQDNGSYPNRSQEQERGNTNSELNQNNQITPNNQIVPQAQQSQEQFDPNLEVTLTDGTKTTYGALQQKGAFQQATQPQGMTGGLDETKLNELALLALLTGNTKALSQIQAYQGIQEKMNPKKDEKALSVTAENKVQLAKSGLRALDEVEKLIVQDPNKVLKSVIPGKLGARDYDSAAFRAVEGLLRARSGAAIPETEVRRYMSANLPSIGDSPEEIKFKLSAFRKDLQDVANTGATTDDSEVLQKLLLGL